MRPFYFILFFSLLIACQDDKSKPLVKKSIGNSHTSFKLRKETGINFVNRLMPTVQLSTFNYQYYQNGGGVAVADFDQNGLQDVFFTSNIESDQLFLNRGDLKFENVTSKARVTGFENGITNSWSTGATIGDVNNDGYPDIYVCKSGNFNQGPGTENLLFINNRDLTFTERGKEFGVNDNRHSTQAVFFDYDKDNDLDLFVLNHSTLFGNSQVPFEISKSTEKSRPHSCSLYKNENGKFVDVTIPSGICRFSYGLGLVSSDINGDGWTDLYVANDFSRPDVMFINNQDGTFTDMLKESTGHVSYFSMGCDVADINNDGMQDISVVDMAPANNFRSKTLMPSMAPENFYSFVNNFGYTPQYMFNALQINHGGNTFSEIAKLAGVHKTDWSWATLLADFDNDGYKDMFVSNGYKFNKMENDFSIEFKKMKQKYNGKIPDEIKKQWLNKPPSYKLPNYIFKNIDGLQFEKYSKEWGLKEETYSNGAAYADFDNDGDLDLVINNIDDPVYLYENMSKTNYLQLVLKAGDRWNPNLNLNAKVEIKYGGKMQLVESTLTRGFQSSVEDIIHFGLGDVSSIDQLTVSWKDGRTFVMKDVKANQRIVVDKNKSQTKSLSQISNKKFFTKELDTGLNFKHTENQYDDFQKELLLPHKNSQHGPFLTKGDVNNDNLEDVFVGGAIGQAGQLFIQTATGKFIASNSAPWQIDKQCEDMGAVFFDADGDKDLDLYVVSGGNEIENGDSNLQDRLYLNDGKGNFTKSLNLLPKVKVSGSKVISFDKDNDGDLDLFVGGRMEPGRYPHASPNQLLENNGGTFKNVLEEKAKDLNKAAIVTDAVAEDYNKDGDIDLIIVGEWSAINIFKNNGDSFVLSTPENLKEERGWWSSIAKADIDGDGDMDFVVGNLGLNYKYKATKKEPFHIYAYDFDESGTLDIVLGYFNEGVCYPLRGRECSSEQMPFITEKFPTYKEFASADLKSVYGENLDKALHRYTTNFESSILLNNGAGNFTLQSLPLEAQYSCINGIEFIDLDKDGNLDILTGGNLFVAEVETPRNDASIGACFLGDGNAGFKFVPLKKSGLLLNKDVKDIMLINANGSKKLVVANNNEPIEVFNFDGI